MNEKTTHALIKVQDKLNECRSILDNTMFGGVELPESDYTKLRSLYSKICETIDSIQW